MNPSSLRIQTRASETAPRPVFDIDGKPYVSSGILLYTIEESGTVSFLVQKVKDHEWIYEDLGGKSAVGDTSIKAVAFRECQEELNHAGGISEEFLDQQLSDPRSYVYCVPDNKYVLYFIYVPHSFKDELDLSVFGTRETLCDVDRTIVWLSYYDFINSSYKLHPRIKPDEIKVNLPLILVGAFRS